MSVSPLLERGHNPPQIGQTRKGRVTAVGSEHRMSGHPNLQMALARLVVTDNTLLRTASRTSEKC